MNRVLNKLKEIYFFILDVIFPKFCVGCGKEGAWICDNCKKEITLIKIPTCPNCKKITRDGRFCRKCRENKNLTGVMVAAYYNEGPLKEAIHNFKYNGIFDLKKELGKLLIEILKRKNFKHVVLVPVPLHKKRKAERGYNQAELLGEFISQNLKYKLIKNGLKRIKFTEPQVSLSGKKRRENVKNIFNWQSKDDIKEKIVILIDDVYTTGATLEECAKILREFGAKEVWGLVLAKV